MKEKKARNDKIVYLHDVKGLSFQQIASIVKGISRQRVFEIYHAKKVQEQKKAATKPLKVIPN